MNARNVSFGIALLALATACKKEPEKKPSEDSEKKTPTAATTAALDTEIAQAVAEVSKRSQNQAKQAAENGPPPNGLLAPGKANSEAPLGSATKIQIGGTGSPPKLQLGGPPIGDKQKGHIEISVRTGPRSALPTIDFELQTANVKADAEGGLPKVEFRTTSAELAKTQLGRVPENVEKMVKKLKGTTFSYQTKDGSVSGPVLFQMAKGANPELATALSATSDALASIVIAFPKEPVGKGAFWMTTSRENYSSTDVVAYRMVRVEEIKGQEATLSVETRRYTPSVALGGEGLPPHELIQFEAKDKAELVAVAGNRLPITGKLTQSLGAMLNSQGRPAPIQTQAQVVFSFPPKDEKK